MGFDWSQFPPHHKYAPATPESLKELYKKQNSNPSYQNFLKTTNAIIFGTFDDHDYGMNNGDKNYKYKKESAMAFLDFIGEDQSGLMYQRAKEGLGVYGVKVFDFSNDDGNYLLSDEEAGLDIDLFSNDVNDLSYLDETLNNDNRRVAIFVLDVRTNKTPWDEAPLPNFDGDFLGEKQWKWFEKSIKRSNASVNIIVSGLQVHSYRGSKSEEIELWSLFPSSRQRLYDAVLQDNVLAPILISGDVHMGQFLRKDCMRTKSSFSQGNNNERMRPLVEITSSGMTHSWGTCFGCQSKLHKTWKYYPCHWLSQSLMTLAHVIFPMPDLMNSQNNKLEQGRLDLLFENGGAENARTGKQYSLQLNFGELEFNWNAKIVKMRIIGKDNNAPPLLSASFSFDQLSGREKTSGKRLDKKLPTKYGRNVMDGDLVKGEFICTNHRPNPSSFDLTLATTCIGLFFLITMLVPPFLLFTIVKKIFKTKKLKQE